ncbi:MAG: DNA polymerase/3'-5' exonuclease PolX [Acidobacteria bacterium]|nr:MAG: DNA polymerase/3'-5' exonuclease PolX [Acidobacteriota bacterium]PYX17497.1 MAG: DNA polymerase/3'-5' exonuclease PolX [Acidobacteriota bacterium]
MDNKAIAGVLYETADLLEIDGQDSFRIRSYRNAAQAIEALPQQIADLIAEPKKVLEIPGIGKGMLANLNEMFKEGRLQLHADLLKRYQPSMLDLLKIQGLGPKTISLIWSAYQVSDLEGVEKLAREGKIQILPRMGEKQEQKLLKAIQDYRRIAGRYLLDVAENEAQKIADHLRNFPGVEKVTPAGSLRRGRETVGDLDVLVTGKACIHDVEREQCIDHIIKLPGLMEIIVRGENKVSFRLRGGMQVDVRFLSPDSFGAALQYFTGSKAHNVALRQRALKMGYTLSEYSLARLENEKGVAGKTEEDIYAKLKLDYIPPELRENQGEIDAAEKHALPALISQTDLRGDVHMHTVETDGRKTIEEMAEAAIERGYKYMAITDHSKNLAFANGLDDKRALEHIQRIREADKKIDGIKIFAGIEVDILADGSLDLSDSVLEQMDLVIASVHSHFNQSPAEMTARLLKAIENPNTSFIGHPTGRMLLRRDAYQFDIDAILRAAAKNKVAMELNSYPDRLDLCDRHLRRAKQRGVKIVINTDSHHTAHLDKIRYGILQARRAWLTRDDVLNTLPTQQFAKAMKHIWA